jgi:transposase-like protein
MTAKRGTSTYKRHRFPTEIISQCVWLYFRFSLSYRDVELLMAERSVVVSYESIRQWCLKFGDEYAQKLRKRRGNQATNGTSMRSSSKSMARRITSGEPLTKMAWYWISW